MTGVDGRKRSHKCQTDRMRGRHRDRIRDGGEKETDKERERNRMEEGEIERQR